MRKLSRLALPRGGAKTKRWLVLKLCWRTCTVKLYQWQERLSMETTFSKLRGNLKSYCDRAVNDRVSIRVRRRIGGDVVLIAADEYASLLETAHLLSSPENATRLLAALGRARRRKVKPMTIKELRAALGI
jgi:antitoxin YefM